MISNQEQDIALVLSFGDLANGMIDGTPFAVRARRIREWMRTQMHDEKAAIASRNQQRVVQQNIKLGEWFWRKKGRAAHRAYAYINLPNRLNETKERWGVLTACGAEVHRFDVVTMFEDDAMCAACQSKAKKK